MRSTKRWTLEKIMAIGDIIAHDDEESSSEGTEAGSTGESGAPVGNSSENSETGGAEGTDDDEEDPKELKKKLQNRREQNERQARELKAAERERDELRKKQEEIDRKSKTELENAQSDLEKSKKTIEAQSETIRRLTVENAFMSLKDIDWHNPSRALSLVDLSEVEFDDNGQVKDPKQIVKAAKALAAAEPYLVKTETTSTVTATKSGQKPGTRKDAGKASDEELARKYRLQD